VSLTFSRLYELFEAELHNYYEKDKNPFDDRHSFGIDPNCVLAQMYFNLFHRVPLMNKVDIEISIHFDFIELIYVILTCIYKIFSVSNRLFNRLWAKSN